MFKNFFLLFLFLFFIVPSSVKAAPANIKLYVQWAQSSPNDWTLIDSSAWNNQPTKLDPIDIVNGTIIGDSLLNNQKGYIFAINIQGVTYNWYDYFSITSDSNSIMISAWRNDPILFPIGSRQADVAIFKALKWDANIGQNNTDQEFILYREGLDYANLVDNLPANTTLMYYSDFIVPDVSSIKPGIYLSDNKWQEHVNVQTLKGWRE